MRISLLVTLGLSLAATASCRKDDAGTTDPDSATDEDLLGIDVGTKPHKRRKPVSVGCIQDPSDPECAEVLGVVESSTGELEFTGDTCRINLCHGHGDCELDPDGFVDCACDDNAGGEDCSKRKR